jgi:nitroreductase
MLDILATRRSIRKYSDKEISERHINSLIKAGLYSASSRGIRPWELIIVQEKDTIRKLSRAKAHGSAFLAGAPLAFVIAGLPDKSDVWVEDASIVSSNMLLEAETLGLGACWIQIRNRTSEDGRPAEAIIREVLGMPADRAVESIIAVGHPAEEKPAYTDEDLHWEKVLREHY